MRENILRLWKDKREKVIFALIFLAGFLLYYKSLSAAFILDDYPSIVDNPVIKHFNFSAIWRHDPSRFLTNLSFAINYAFHGLKIHGWHVVNVFLHCAVAAAVFQTTNIVLQTPKVKSLWNDERRFAVSLITALLFLVHPLQTQAVINAVQRSTLLASLFYFLSLKNYFQGRITDEGKYYCRSVVFAFLGMLSKPLAMTLPLMMIASDIILFGVEKRSSIKAVVTIFTLGIIAIWVPAGFIGIEK